MDRGDQQLCLGKPTYFFADARRQGLGAIQLSGSSTRHHEAYDWKLLRQWLHKNGNPKATGI
jgi:hypothetical protein